MWSHCSLHCVPIARPLCLGFNPGILQDIKGVCSVREVGSVLLPFLPSPQASTYDLIASPESETMQEIKETPKYKDFRGTMSFTLLSVAFKNCWRGNYSCMLVMEIIMTIFWNYVFDIFLIGNLRGQWIGIGGFFAWKLTLDNWQHNRGRKLKQPS